MVIPNTNIYLLKVPLTLSNKHQLTFTSKTQQHNYFMSLPKLLLEDATYQRKDKYIRYPGNADELINFNYVMYQNENSGNKWYYAFITNIIYKSENSCDIYITTDVWQTWQFDITWKQSFVEREMIGVQNDIPGMNILPENLETGEMKVQSSKGLESLKPVYIIAYLGDTFNNETLSQDGFTYNGIWSSLTFIVTNTLDVALKIINDAGFGEQIFTVFSIPLLAVEDFVPNDTPEEHHYYALPMAENFKQTPKTLNLGTRPISLDGYIPRNKKLLTFPYCYAACTPNSGKSQIFKFENFQNPTQPQVKIISEIAPNPTVQIIPQNYNGQSGNSQNYAASLTGYPTVSYRTDYYNAWLAQHSETMEIKADYMEKNYRYNTVSGASNLITNLLFPGLKAMSGTGGISGVTGGISPAMDLLQNDLNYEYFINSQMALKNQQQLIPDSGNITGSNSTLLGYDIYTDNLFNIFTIKAQFAEHIDKYFDMYGYTTNMLKIPNLNNRSQWNYIKTLGANILGDIPQQDLSIIKDLFNNGITLWHNPNTFLDYSANNRS